MSKVYRLRDVVNAINEDGYTYRRSIQAGIKRGEFYPAPLNKNADASERFVLLRARPTHIRGLYNRVTGQPAPHHRRSDRMTNIVPFAPAATDLSARLTFDADTIAAARALKEKAA